ncbi:hypothetical protein EVAR_52410_1 [Eumeta japonica]|uniref:Uncharacterized protein n=1 Tax=Eumeta variegata TaxID=151549 RepID=A0A4C1Z008_EUMVA|nr:hypothetical protein EVAR_52410_1 [Eumeta japonica]
MMQIFAGSDSDAIYDNVTGEESWITVTIPKPKDSVFSGYVFHFEEFPTKGKRGRSVKKKMLACFFGMIGYFTTVVLEDKKQSLQTGTQIMCLLFWKKFWNSDLAVGFSFIETTLHHMFPDE